MITSAILAVAALVIMSVLILASGDSASGAQDFQAFRAKMDALFSRENLLSVVWAAGLILAAASSWYFSIVGDGRESPVAESVYWAIQTMTTVGYGTSISEDFDEYRYHLASFWMVVMALYWVMVGTTAVDTLRA